MPVNLTYNEQELLLQIAEGDEPSFAKLVKSYSGLLSTYLFKLTKDRDIARDVVQEIFTQLWLTRESLRNVESFKAYLFTISRNHAVRLLKSIDKEYKHRQEWWQLTQSGVSIQETNEQALLENAYDSIMQDAIGRLPTQQKRAWLLARKEGRKYAEIAVEMNISKETVKKYLQLASASITDYVKTNGISLILTYLVIKL